MRSNRILLRTWVVTCYLTAKGIEFKVTKTTCSWLRDNCEKGNLNHKVENFRCHSPKLFVAG